MISFYLISLEVFELEELEQPVEIFHKVQYRYFNSEADIFGICLN
jgi:hypothetical protein